MQDDLKIYNLYRNSDASKVDKFDASLKSSYSIAANYEKIEADFAWLDIMEDTIKYLDNILRNPNRFIINDEEVVNVEQARRITVESIKHLAKHTNYIQEIEDNGDVRPSKVLNINKDESFNTYENRLIYTLINNMRTFIDFKESKNITASSLKDEKKCEYTGVTKIGTEKISYSFVLNAKTNVDKKDGFKNGMSVEQRIARLKLRISDLTNMPVYVALAKEHVAKVIPPIKKTNLILKNTNFQYAMKLWDFIQNYIKDEDTVIRDKRVIEEDVKLKEMLDDAFLLNYLAVSSINNNEDEMDTQARAEAVESLTNKMIEKIVQLNADLPVDKMLESIGEKIAVVKNKKEASLAELEKKYNERIQLFVDKINEFSFR